MNNQSGPISNYVYGMLLCICCVKIFFIPQQTQQLTIVVHLLLPKFSSKPVLSPPPHQKDSNSIFFVEQFPTPPDTKNRPQTLFKIEETCFWMSCELSLSQMRALMNWNGSSSSSRVCSSSVIFKNPVIVHLILFTSRMLKLIKSSWTGGR